MLACLFMHAATLSKLTLLLRDTVPLRIAEGVRPTHATHFPFATAGFILLFPRHKIALALQNTVGALLVYLVLLRAVLLPQICNSIS